MLEARRKVTVGERIYWPGETLTPEDAAEMRSRPAFSLLVEEGVLVEHSPPVEETESEPQVEDAQVTEQQTEESAEVFKCPHAGCDYESDKKVNLNAHIRRSHGPGKKTRKTRKR